MQQHQEPPPPVVTSDAMKRQILEFVGKANATAAQAGNAAAVVKKQAVTELLSKLDSMSPMELSSLQGSGGWISHLMPDSSKSAGAPANSHISAPRPVCKVKTGGWYSPYHFMARKMGCTGDVLASVFSPRFDDDFDDESVGSIPAAELKKNFQAISSFGDIMSCAGRLVEFARLHQATRTVKSWTRKSESVFVIIDIL
eukprot:SAG31_NODE_739_length_12444_cov_14.976831_6_plen_199_part_00